MTLAFHCLLTLQHLKSVSQHSFKPMNDSLVELLAWKESEDLKLAVYVDATGLLPLRDGHALHRQLESLRVLKIARL